MTRKEAVRQTHQENVLLGLGFTREEAEALRRISMTLHHWYEHECNGAIQRDEVTGKPFWYNGNARGAYASHYPMADRERGAEKRLAAIIKARNARFANAGNGQEHLVSTYLQTDPRGAVLYILRPGDVPEGKDAGSYYNRGICVY